MQLAVQEKKRSLAGADATDDSEEGSRRWEKEEAGRQVLSELCDVILSPRKKASEDNMDLD